MIIVIILLAAILITLLHAWVIIGFLLLVLLFIAIVCSALYFAFRGVKNRVEKREKLAEYKESEKVAFKVFNEEIREHAHGKREG